MNKEQIVTRLILMELFGGLVGGSCCNIYLRKNNDKDLQKLVQSWTSPEYFKTFQNKNKKGVLHLECQKKMDY